VDNKLTIIGGGITGLSAAYIAAKAGKKVTVLEGSANFGGLLNTFEIGGNRLEFYYHHFFTHDSELNWLIKDLGIADKLRFHPTTMGVFRGGKIYDFNSPVDLLKFSPISFWGKIRFGLSSLFLGKVAKWENYENVSCLAWFYKYAGKNTTDALWKPLLDIKFGPYADKVPLAWMVGRLRQRMNSRKKGEEKLGYVDSSLQTLLNALLEKLNGLGVELIHSAPVEKLNIAQGKLLSVQTPKGIFEGGQFLSTIPATFLTNLLTEVPTLANKTREIKYFGAVCTILELDRPLSSVYWLNVSDPGFPFGGVIEHTNLIPAKEYNGSHIVYLSRYFAMEEPIAQKSSEEISELMIAPLNKIYPTFKKEWIKNINVFRTNTAATVCDLNFSKRVPSCKTEVENLYLANMAHIYPDERSANNSIRVAAEACKVLGIPSEHVPYGASLSAGIGF